jgi:N-acetylglucosaminyldiphosphoundecaprenol N-acetyl-beta-D-mannosaminyltransferase
MARPILLGVEVDAVTIEDLLALVTNSVDRRVQSIIAHHNLHSVYLYQRDPEMRRLYALAKAAHIDGMPLVSWGRLLGYPLRRDHRVTYVDWVRPLLSEAESGGWRVFYLGGRPGVAEKAAASLRRDFPRLQIQSHHGYFDDTGDENEAVLATIGEFDPDVLMVGMGMPRQERWVVANVGKVNASVVLTSGACFDYVAGAVPTPPRWMGQAGLEWTYRLLSEPRRLWRRYLVEPWFLLGPAARDLATMIRTGRPPRVETDS